MLELAILGLLKEHPMHGYDLRKRLRGDFGLLSSLSFGSLYPALARLEAAGAVHELPSERRPQDAPAPGTTTAFTHAGSIAGERAALRARLASRRAAPTRSGSGTRGRRVFELTDRGDELFHRLLVTEDPKLEDGRGFALRWSFARYMGPEDRLSLLERRRAQLVASREGSRRAAESPWRPLDRYQRSLVEHANEVAEHDLTWIDRLISSERAALASPSVLGSAGSSTSAAGLPPAIANPSVGTSGPALKTAARERSEP
jgi:DNA-binding PadR family transcriptional regulator